MQAYENKLATAATALQAAESEHVKAESSLHSLRVQKGQLLARLEAQVSGRRRGRGGAGRYTEVAIKAMQSELQLARAEVAELATALLKAREVVPTGGRRPLPADSSFVIQPLKQGGRYPPVILHLLRELVVTGHVPLRRVATTVDICFTLFTRLLPTEEYQICQTLAASSFSRLGVIDNTRCALAHANYTGPWSINGDTGNKKDCEREVIVIAMWSKVGNAPYTEALACTDIARDQSARNGSDVLERQMVAARMNHLTCVAAGGDSTGHALLGREGFVKRLRERGLSDPDQVIISGCIRYLCSLFTLDYFPVSLPLFLFTPDPQTL